MEANVSAACIQHVNSLNMIAGIHQYFPWLFVSSSKVDSIFDDVEGLARISERRTRILRKKHAISCSTSRPRLEAQAKSNLPDMHLRSHFLAS